MGILSKALPVAMLPGIDNSPLPELRQIEAQEVKQEGIARHRRWYRITNPAGMDQTITALGGKTEGIRLRNAATSGQEFALSRFI